MLLASTTSRACHVPVWSAGLPLTVFVLLLGVDAPADRTTVIVLGAALTPALAAVGLTVGLVVLRRHARRRSAAPRG
jgi:hypothetical protein